jgi:hypothetical protein
LGAGIVATCAISVFVHPNSRIDELLPWAYICDPELKAVA